MNAPLSPAQRAGLPTRITSELDAKRWNWWLCGELYLRRADDAAADLSVLADADLERVAVYGGTAAEAIGRELEARHDSIDTPDTRRGQYVGDGVPRDQSGHEFEPLSWPEGLVQL